MKNIPLSLTSMEHKIIVSSLILTEYRHQLDGVLNNLTLHKKISPAKVSNGKE